ncbi:DUF2314 domain-containing protein [Rhizobium sophorae]|uniref:DUF2314 domain-containing protein n=1 Tax=Rhizobium sophorae TaxID=1535242 RepID=UPI0035E45974
MFGETSTASNSKPDIENQPQVAMQPRYSDNNFGSIECCAASFHASQCFDYPSWSFPPNSLWPTTIQTSSRSRAAIRPWRKPMRSPEVLHGFLEKLRNPPPGTENYSIKLGFTDKGKDVALTTDEMEPNVKYMWVYQIKASGDHFTALLGDTPEYIHNIKADDRVQFEKSDIFDWVYIENGKVKGNYTACPLLLAGPKEQLEQYLEIYSIVCD